MFSRNRFVCFSWLSRNQQTVLVKNMFDYVGRLGLDRHSQKVCMYEQWNAHLVRFCLLVQYLVWAAYLMELRTSNLCRKVLRYFVFPFICYLLPHVDSDDSISCACSYGDIVSGEISAFFLVLAFEYRCNSKQISTSNPCRGIITCWIETCADADCLDNILCLQCQPCKIPCCTEASHW